MDGPVRNTSIDNETPETWDPETSQALHDWYKQNSGRLDHDNDGFVRADELKQSLQDPSFQGNDRVVLQTLSDRANKANNCAQGAAFGETPEPPRDGDDKKPAPLPDIEILESCRDTLSRVFKRIDANGNGKVTRVEVEKALKDPSIKGKDAHAVVAFDRFFDDIAKLSDDQLLKERQIDKADMAKLMLMSPDTNLVQGISAIGTGDRPSSRRYRSPNEAMQSLSAEIRNVNEITRIYTPENKDAWKQIERANATLNDLHKEYRRDRHSPNLSPMIRRASEEADKMWQHVPESRTLYGWWGE